MSSEAKAGDERERGEHPLWEGDGREDEAEWESEGAESICVVSAAICVSEHITQSVRPVPTPPLSACCLLDADNHAGTRLAHF